MRFTSVSIANSTITSATWIPFLMSSRHIELWLSGTNPSGVYFNADELFSSTNGTATASNAQVVSGLRVPYHSAQALDGLWVLASGSAGSLNLIAY